MFLYDVLLLLSFVSLKTARLKSSAKAGRRINKIIEATICRARRPLKKGSNIPKRPLSTVRPAGEIPSKSRHVTTTNAVEKNGANHPFAPSLR